MIPRRRAALTGAVVGAAVVSRSAHKQQAQQQQMYTQQQQQAELYQAQAEARAAQDELKHQQQQQQAQPPTYVYLHDAQPLAADQGRTMFNEALAQHSPPPAAIKPTMVLKLKGPHIVDEASLAAYQIISVPQGATVLLTNGDLVHGLGGDYGDYIEVNYNGKVGKISRLVVQPMSNGPPPALSTN
jgi:multidrug efflux pump subunit AcrA (membrane-fusion protein)